MKKHSHGERKMFTAKEKFLRQKSKIIQARYKQDENYETIFNENYNYS